MLVVSFVVIGVAPRTLGRQHDAKVALLSAGPLSLVTTILGPIPALLIMLGNAITPGRGLRDDVVLALGNPPPRRLMQYAAHAGYLPDPWAPDLADQVRETIQETLHDLLLHRGSVFR